LKLNGLLFRDLPLGFQGGKNTINSSSFPFLGLSRRRRKTQIQ